MNLKSITVSIVLGGLLSSGSALADEKKPNERSTIASFYMASNTLAIEASQMALENELLTKEDIARANAIIVELTALNAKLRILDARIREGKPASHMKKSFSEQVTDLQYKTYRNSSNLYSAEHGGIALTPTGPVPILSEDPPIISPGDDAWCQEQGDAVKADCMEGAAIRSACGIDRGGPSPGFTCTDAGNNYTTACRVASMIPGASSPPKPPSDASAARAECRAKEDDKDVDPDPAQTQTSGGN